MAIGCGGRIPQKRPQRFARQPRARRHPAQVDQRRIKVDQADRGGADHPARQGRGRALLRRRHDQRHPRGTLPAGPLAPVLLLAKVPAVIPPQDDHGIAGGRALVDRRQQLADLGVDEGDAGQIGGHGGLPLAVLHDGGVGSCGDGIAGPAATRVTQVIQIVGPDRGQLDVEAGIEIEILPRGEERDVRTVETHGEEPRLRGRLRLLADPLHGPVGDLAVAHVGVLDVERSPIERFPVGRVRGAVARHPVEREHDGAALEHRVVLRIGRALGGQFRSRVGGRFGSEGAPALLRVELRLVRARPLLVEEFSGAEGAVAGLLEMLGQQHQVGPRRADGRPVVGEHAGLEGLEAAEHRGPRGIAERGGAVGVGEGDPTPGEAVEVGRLDLRMAPQRPDPVIEVVDRDEEDIGGRGPGRRGGVGITGDGQQEQGGGGAPPDGERHGEVAR